jgi:hypothetical protein
MNGVVCRVLGGGGKGDRFNRNSSTGLRLGGWGAAVLRPNKIGVQVLRNGRGFI